MSEKKDYINFKTPLGKARYPKLDKQDVYKGNDVGFKFGLTFDDPKDLAAIEAQVEAATKKWFPGRKAPKFTPIREDKEGNVYVEFKAFKKRPVFTAKGVKLDDASSEKIAARIGGGSIVRLSVSITESNGGIAGYFNSIQLAKLVERGSGDSFEAVEGFDEPEDTAGFGDVSAEADGLDI